MALATTDNLTIVASRTIWIEAAAFVPQLSRYSLVSAVALATDFGVYVFLCTLAVNAPVAGVVGYALGMIAHYVLSSAFVFDITRTQKSAHRRFAEFAASGLLGLMLTGFVIAMLTEYLAASAIAAKAVATVVSFIAVFLVRRRFVFAPAHHERDFGAPVYPKSGSCD